MKRSVKRFVPFAAIPALAVLLLGLASVPATAAVPAARMELSALAAGPLYFEADDAARFVARGQDCSVLLAPDSATLVLSKPAGDGGARLAEGFPGERSAPTRFVRLQLQHANPAAVMSGLEPLRTRANYFLGNDPARWRTGVPLFTQVQVDEVYPGTRLIYHADHSARLEYDFILQPGARPERIAFGIEGADQITVAAPGDLVLDIAGDEVRQRRPVIYQEAGGVRKTIAGGYRRIDASTVGFWVGDYNRALPLVIDPTFESGGFLTYLGGAKNEYGWAIARDSSGNIFVAGETLSKDFVPLTNRFGIVNSVGHTNAYAGGTHAFGDAFIAKYDANGSNLFLSYFGGKSDDGALALDVDSAGNAYVTGFTDSTNFPLLPNFPPMIKTNVSDFGARNNNPFRLYPVDAFVAKFDPNGVLQYSALVGGRNRDAGLAIKVDGLARAYIAGLTESSNFFGTNLLAATVYQPTNGGRSDGFIAVLDPTGTSLLYSTYLGGSSDDHAQGIALDNSTDPSTVWITGFTSSTNFPGTNNSLPPLVSMVATNPVTNAFNHLNNQPTISTHTDAFIARLAPLGTDLDFSMFLGGTNDESGLAIALDDANNAYVTGYTFSRDFPTNVITTTFIDTNAITGDTNDIITAVHFSQTNFTAHVFVTTILSGDTLGYSTQFGGSRIDKGNAIAVDGSHQAYVAGSTTSTNFAQVIVDFHTNDLVNTNKIKTRYFVTNNPAFTDLRTNAVKHMHTTNDAFVVVLSADGANFVSTNSVLFGSNTGNDQANGIVVDPLGAFAYIIGDTTSLNLATTNAWQNVLGNGKKPGRLSDAFVGRLQFSP